LNLQTKKQFALRTCRIASSGEKVIFILTIVNGKREGNDVFLLSFPKNSTACIPLTNKQTNNKSINHNEENPRNSRNKKETYQNDVHRENCSARTERRKWRRTQPTPSLPSPSLVSATISSPTHTHTRLAAPPSSSCIIMG
jgi:hypothetical protein